MLKQKLFSHWPQLVGIFLLIALDASLTYFGQPESYWTDHSTNNELSWIFAPALNSSPLHFVLAVLAYMLVILSLVLLLPRLWSLAIAINFMLAHFAASTGWLIYQYEFGYNLNFWFPPLIGSMLIFICFDQCEKFIKERDSA